IPSETGNSKVLGQQTEFKMASWGGHGGLEQTPHQATIDGERHTIHVAGTFRSQESDDSGEFLRCAKAARGNLAFPPGKNFFGLGSRARGDRGGQAVEASRASVTRANVVHGNAIGSVLIGQRARQASDGGTERIREQEAIHGLFDNRRSNRNQTSPLVLLHARQSFLGKINSAHQKLVEGSAPGFRRGILKHIRRRAPELVTQISIRPSRASTSATKAATPVESVTFSA